MPTIYKWKINKENKFDGNRLFNLTYTGKYVSGGLHMMNIAFIPTAVLKELSAAEDDFYSGFIKKRLFILHDCRRSSHGARQTL